MPVFKWQVDSPPNLVSLFSFIKDNSSVIFSSNNIYFAQKGHIKWKFLRLSSARVKIHLIPQVNFSSNFASFFIVMTYNSSVNFKLILFYFGLTVPIKIPILRIAIALVKICHVSHVIFQATNQFFFKFCVTIQCHER